MNKLLFFLYFIIAIVCICCVVKPGEKPRKSTVFSNNMNSSAKEYEVYKIDSIDNFYLLYARKGGWSYKIISKKENQGECDNIIQVSKRYDLELKDAKWVTVGRGDSTRTVYLFNVSCLVYNDTTEICIEKNDSLIAGLFVAENVKGLCLWQHSGATKKVPNYNTNPNSGQKFINGSKVKKALPVETPVVRSVQ